MTTATEETTAPATLLFVDDEPRVLTSMRVTFQRDYEVHTASSAQAALELLREQAVDVVVSDQRMPGMTGVELLNEVKELAPETMRILLTGYADLAAIESAINEGEVFRYLMKPCPLSELREAVALAVSAVREREEVAHSAQAAAGTAEDDSAEGDVAKNEGNQTVIDQLPPGAASEAAAEAAKAAGPARTDAPTAHATSDAEPADTPVELLVLSRDDALLSGIRDAVDATYRVHHARDVDEAVSCLAEHPVGVLITDVAIDEESVSALTSELKRHVPELVTIVASDRQDAHMLINLINHGQIFRFLLKPPSIGQCRIWLSSAVKRHAHLVADPSATRRYRVAERQPEAGEARLFGNLMSRAQRLRNRLLGVQRSTA